MAIHLEAASVVHAGPVEEQVVAAVDECAICKDDLDDRIKELACRHKYHEECIDSWLRDRDVCPLCRFNVAVEAPEQLPPRLQQLVHPNLLQRRQPVQQPAHREEMLRRVDQIVQEHRQEMIELPERRRVGEAVDLGEMAGTLALGVVSTIGNSIMAGSQIGDGAIQVAAFSALTLGALIAASAVSAKASDRLKMNKICCAIPTIATAVATVGLVGGMSATQSVLQGSMVAAVQVTSIIVGGCLGKLGGLLMAG